MVDILVGKTAVSRNAEMLEAVVRVKPAVGPFVEAVIGAYLVERIFFAFNNLLQTQEFRHFVHFGVKQIVAVMGIHDGVLCRWFGQRYA